MSRKERWLAGRNVVVDEADLIVLERRTFEEVVLQLDGEQGRVELPMAIVAEREANGRLHELRIYHSTWALTGHHANRPPLLQPNPDVHVADSDGGGIPLEHCAVTNDGRACALEYNVVRWGRSDLPPEAGVGVYGRGPSGKLAAARIYPDSDPPLGPYA